MFAGIVLTAGTIIPEIGPYCPAVRTHKLSRQYMFSNQQGSIF